MTDSPDDNDLPKAFVIFLAVCLYTLILSVAGWIALNGYEKFLEVQTKYGKLCQPERPQP